MSVAERTVGVGAVLSDALKWRIANDAAFYAGWLATGSLKTAGGANRFVPVVTDTGVAVDVYDKDQYYIFQSRGIAAFEMTSLQGKTVPMMFGNNVVFRVADHIGEHTGNWHAAVMRNSFGDMYKTQDDRRWTHRGLWPKDFFKDGMSRSLEEHHDEIVAEVTQWLKQ